MCPVSIICLYEKDKKISTTELKYLQLQQNLGVGKIGNLDRKETKKINYRHYSKLIEHKRILFNIHLLSQTFCSKGVETLKPPIDCGSFEKIDNDSDGSDFEVELAWPMRVKFKNIALTSVWFGVSGKW